jgi:DNA polymerase-3 subunit beta
MRKLPGESVRFESDARLLASIVSGNAKYSLIGMSAEEYPELPSVSGGYPIVINQGVLKDMVRQTIFAVAVNDSKIVHTGVKFDISGNILKLIAIDGFRLAVRKENIDYSGDDISFIVPAKTLSEIMKLMNDDDGTISLGVGKRHIVFEIGSYSVVSRLLEGEFKLRIRYSAQMHNKSQSQHPRHDKFNRPRVAHYQREVQEPHQVRFRRQYDKTFECYLARYCERQRFG